MGGRGGRGCFTHGENARAGFGKGQACEFCASRTCRVNAPKVIAVNIYLLCSKNLTAQKGEMLVHALGDRRRGGESRP